jgi:peptidoglycan/LPS O-acetylase OafA/YrhL
VVKIIYRPEIDGLRAIAVGAVILYHAQITILSYQPFKGGFIGVDIFFVISGYLITSIILKELVTTGSFLFKHFYERRIRRILPVLLFVMMVSFPVAWMYLLPSSFLDFSKSILYSLGFSSNFYFHYSGQEYGAESGLLKPFLHTWSLSVEEQFYILFPIVLLVTFKYFRKYLVHILILGFVISLGLADWGSRNYPYASFYFLHTRMWELLAGSILAYFETINGKRSENKTLNLILPSIGVFLIGHSILFFNDKMFHPSFYLLSPIIGVCLIIWFSNKDELITKMLSTKLFVGIGLISYSLYLWHYPIFAFSRISEVINASLFYKFILGIVMILISILTYIFIEKPARNKKIGFKKIISYISIVSVAIILLSTFTIYKKGKINKQNIQLSKFLQNYGNSDNLNNVYRSECKYSASSKNFLKEEFFKKELTKCIEKYSEFILIIGDSHGVDLYNSLSKVTDKNEFILALNQNSCRPPKNIFLRDNECNFLNTLKFIEKYNRHVKHILYTHKGSYFLTNTSNESNYSQSQFRKLPIDKNQIQNTVEYLKLIKKINPNISLVGPHLEPNINFTVTNLKKIFVGEDLEDKTNYDLLEVDEQLKKITKNFNISYISKIEALDFNLKRDLFINNKLTFSDTDHWSDFGEIYYGNKLIKNIILKSVINKVY